MFPTILLNRDFNLKLVSEISLNSLKQVYSNRGHTNLTHLGYTLTNQNSKAGLLDTVFNTLTAILCSGCLVPTFCSLGSHFYYSLLCCFHGFCSSPHHHTSQRANGCMQNWRKERSDTVQGERYR